MFSIRPARHDDHAAFARLFLELEIPDPIPELEPWWAQRGPTTLVAEQEGTVVGYAWYELMDTMLYIRNVVSDRAHRREGIGRALMNACIERARAAGAERWCLNVKDDNAPAIRLYESMGLRVAYFARVLRVTWDLADRARDGAAVIRTLVPEDDARFEDTLRILQGQLQRMRAQGRLLLGARDGAGAITGLSAFDPSFPGAFPFRAASVDTAFALLAEMRKHHVSFPEGDWRHDRVQIVIEGQDALADALEGWGSERVFRIMHLAGALPTTS